jgi:hypothetical protein
MCCARLVIAADVDLPVHPAITVRSVVGDGAVRLLIMLGRCVATFVVDGRPVGDR